MWINSKEGLNFHRGVLSTKAGSGGVMATIKEAYCGDVLSDANGIKSIMETKMKLSALLQVFADREIYSDGEDEEHDKQLRENIISDKMSKLQNFSLGPGGID
ncbi:hypothetical protein Aduo_001965 [Ancylostoma duodenale]